MATGFESVDDFRKRFNLSTGASIDNATATSLLENNFGEDQLGFMSDNNYLKSIRNNVNSDGAANYMKGLASSALAGDWKGKSANDILLSQNMLDADMYADLGLNPLDIYGNGTTPESGGSWSKWFGDKGNQAMIGAGLSAGQLGLGLASYLSQSDFLKKQGKLLDQQLASNQYNIDRQKASDEANRRSYEAAEARRYGTKPTATA